MDDVLDVSLYLREFDDFSGSFSLEWVRLSLRLLSQRDLSPLLERTLVIDLRLYLGRLQSFLHNGGIDESGVRNVSGMAGILVGCQVPQVQCMIHAKQLEMRLAEWERDKKESSKFLSEELLNVVYEGECTEIIGVHLRHCKELKNAPTVEWFRGAFRCLLWC